MRLHPWVFRVGCLLVLAGLLAPVAASAQRAAPPLRRAAQLISTQGLKADLAFLASPDLVGRDTGSVGDHVAEDFIAERFQRLGLKPMGDDGTYFQHMIILTAKVDRAHTALTAQIAGAQHSFTYGRDYYPVRSSIRNATGCGPVAFAGYGINAPEYGYDDFAGMDLKGKVALVLNREPQADNPHSKFMGAWDTYHAFSREKIEALRKQGVAGLLMIRDRVRRHVLPIPASAPRARGGPTYALEGQMWDIPVFSISRAVADQLLAPSGKTADQLQAQIDASLKPDSFLVPHATACVSKAFTDIEPHDGRNVAALLPGTDPALRNTYVLVTAHHDHMGERNGQIYYGADDDGSGVAAVMETARAFVRGGIHPRRSILFLTFDGEERIWLGSYYYVTHPLVPLRATVADLNMDMIGRNEDDPNWPVPPDHNVNMVNVLGTRYNPALAAVIDRENHGIGLKLDYKMDRVAPDSLWARSDQFWFAVLHVPQVEFQTGLHPDYHTANDTWQRINYPKLTRIVRLIFLSVNHLGESSQRIPFDAAGAPPGVTQPGRPPAGSEAGGEKVP